MPYSSFAQSAECLDYRRLGKQRAETYQILLALLHDIGSPSVKKHWVTNMWRGHERTLLTYQEFIVMEWVYERNYRDIICMDKTRALLTPNEWRARNPDPPPWLGDEAFHISHQSNLVRKKPEHYRLYFPDVPDDIPYVHPV